MRLENPCKSKCYDCDPIKNRCNGCGLRMDERSRWFMMSDSEKRVILERISEEEGTRLDEETVLKTAARKRVGGSSPSPSAKK